MRRAALLLLFSCFLCLSFLGGISSSYAVETPQEMLPDPQEELRAEEIGSRLRCLVCQNESIEDSTAPLARDLRHIVRFQIRKGKNNEEIMQWMTQRYGEFIRLKPRFSLENSLLWIIPFLTLMIGFYYAYRICSRPEIAPPPPLSDEEKALLQKRLSSKDPQS